jgi:hypothetical protein
MSRLSVSTGFTRAGGRGVLLRVDRVRNGRLSAGRRAGGGRDAAAGAGARRSDRGRCGRPDRRRAPVHRVEGTSPCLLPRAARCLTRPWIEMLVILQGPAGCHEQSVNADSSFFFPWHSLSAEVSANACAGLLAAFLSHRMGIILKLVSYQQHSAAGAFGQRLANRRWCLGIAL